MLLSAAWISHPVQILPASQVPLHIGQNIFDALGQHWIHFCPCWQMLSSRSVLLILLASICNLKWVLEQPRNSFLEDLPRFQWLWGVVKAWVPTNQDTNDWGIYGIKGFSIPRENKIHYSCSIFMVAMWYTVKFPWEGIHTLFTYYFYLGVYKGHISYSIHCVYIYMYIYIYINR